MTSSTQNPACQPIKEISCSLTVMITNHLSLHHNHRLQPCHQLRVLVSLGSLLGQEVLAVYAHCDTPGIQLVEQVLAAQRLLGGGTTLAASGTVAGCAESLLHGTLRPNKYERITAHIAWYEHGLTHCTILFWYSRMTG